MAYQWEDLKDLPDPSERPRRYPWWMYVLAFIVIFLILWGGP